jgi:hypothetical protein
MYKISKTVVSIDIGSMELLSRTEDLTKKDYRVLLFLMARLDSMNYTRLDKKQMADTLDISKDDINRSLCNLANAFILIEGSDAHVKKGYKFLL